MIDVSKIELWCPGPSLVPHIPTTDWVVTVNRAAFALDEFRAQCHHIAVARDMKLLRKIVQDERFRPDTIFTDNNNALGVMALVPDAHVYTDDMLKGRCHDIRFKYSKMVALAVCHLMGADEILVHGDDMEGTEDWDRVIGGLNRTAKRWDVEKEQTADAVKFLKKVDTKVTWVGA